MNFVQFTEHNDHEGEDWNFWLQLDGNEEQLKELNTWLNTFDASETYELDMTPVDESEVDILVKHSRSGYMDYENEVTGTFTCPVYEGDGQDEDAIWDWLNDNFYKGDIERQFK